MMDNGSRPISSGDCRIIFAFHLEFELFLFFRRSDYRDLSFQVLFIELSTIITLKSIVRRRFKLRAVKKKIALSSDVSIAVIKGKSSFASMSNYKSFKMIGEN